MIRAGPAFAVLALALAGCTLPREGRPLETRAYDLLPPDPGAPDPPAPDPASSRLAPATLAVEAFTSSEALEREGIVWRRGPVETGSYASYRWARPPRQAVRDVVAAALARSLGPIVVATEPAPVSPDLVLRGHLARCEEVDREGRWSGKVELRLALVRRDGREVLRRVYEGEEEAAARNPEAVALALRHVVQELGESAARDVAEALVSGARAPGGHP